MEQIINYQLSIVNRRGVALLVVLLIVMVITILSLGFMSRSDVELACGQNMILRTQMDYLAESGLEHARGLILNPQDINNINDIEGEYRLDENSSDYYNVTAARDDSEPNDYCNYIIDCDSYRLKDGEYVGRSGLSARLRIDPCIALWTDPNTTLWSGVIINGDVRCGDTLTNQGIINGDVFANTLTGAGTKDGQKYYPADLLLSCPSITFDNITLGYSYGSLSGQTFGPYDPPQVCYSSGNLILTGNIRIEGMLFVNGDLTVTGTNNVIIAGKNLLALFVNGDLIIENGSELQITGLAVVNDSDTLISANGASLNILGGLFAKGKLAQFTEDSSGGNIVILYNGPTFQFDSGRTALRFDGINDYAQTDDDETELQLTDDYTLSVWIKPNSSQNPWAGIISKCNPDGSTNHWTLQFDNTSSRRLIIYQDTSWNTGITLSNLTADGLWHHVAVVRSGNTMTAYLDDVTKNSGPFNDDPDSGNGHLNIGCDRTASSSYVYGGLIDEIRIYNQALNPNEMSGTSGLIGLFRLDETGANISITTDPITSAIRIWPEPGLSQKWSPAAGSFFRSIERK